MMIALRAKNKLVFIDGSCKRPKDESEYLLQWERCNAIVLSWILNAVSKDIFASIVYSRYACAVWGDLKERFDKVNGSRIFALHREIDRLVQGNSTISTYYSKLKQLWDEFGALVILPFCSCDSSTTYIAIDQQQKLLQFLMGLNDSYTAIRSQILMINPLPSVSQAFAIISQEESICSVLSFSSPPYEGVSSSFFSAQDKKKPSIKCDYCNFPGHTKAYCYKLVGYPPGHRLFKTPNRNHKPQREWHDRTDKGRTPNKAHNAVTHHEAEMEANDKISSAGQFFYS